MRDGSWITTHEAHLHINQFPKEFIEDALRGRTTARPPLVKWTWPRQEDIVLGHCGQTYLAYLGTRQEFGSLGGLLVGVLGGLGGVLGASGCL